MAGDPHLYQPGVAARFRDRVVAVGEELKSRFPQAWAKVQNHGDDGEFNRLLASACQQAGIPAFLNGKRGNPNDLSRDVLVFENPTGARDRSGRFQGIEIIDVIVGHESPGARVDMLDVTVVEDRNTGQMFMPDGFAIEPPPLGAPTPGGATGDAPRWETRHRDLLMGFPPQSTPDAAWVRRVAEGFAAAFPGEGWGLKSADPSRPQSDNVIARKTPAGLFGYQIIPQSATPSPVVLTGQHFIPVAPGGHAPGPAAPSSQPQPQAGRAYPGDATFQAIGEHLFADYREGGQAPNAGMAPWIARVIWDHVNGLSLDDAIRKHRREWRSALGLQPE
jgi:hypothetical protein